MLIMRANATMDAVFRKTIKVMGQNVAWDGRLVFNNNTLILPGALKSLLFSFDNRKIIGTVIEEELDGEELVQPSDRIMENSVNMVLYVFGKWNLIKGLKVQQDYSQINSIFNGVLQEVGASVEATGENCRFYKDGIRITYEEVIGLILEYLHADVAEGEADAAEGQGADVSLEDRQKIGLWHKIVWKSADIAFAKEVTTLEQRKHSRMGKHFYCTGYKCPACGEKLHMTVYPDGAEEIIDTDEGKVLASRVYTCPKCMVFYTPRPDRVLMDYEVYVMDFEEDSVAYDDYLEMISKNGDRTCNSNLNRYLSSPDEPQNADDELARLKSLFANVAEASDEELMAAWEKSDSAMFPEDVARQAEKQLHGEVKRRGLGNKWLSAKKNAKPEKNGISEKSNISEKTGKSEKTAPSGKAGILEKNSTSEKTGISGKNDVSGRNADKAGGNAANRVYDQEFLGKISRMTKEELEEAEQDIARRVRETDNSDGNGDEGLEQLRQLKGIGAAVGKQLNQLRLLELKGILSGASGGSYKDVAAAYEKVKLGIYPDDARRAAAKSLKNLMDITGRREMEGLMLSLPNEPSLQEYNSFKSKLMEYSGMDNADYLAELDGRRDAVELRELGEYIRKNNKRPKDRKALVALADAVGKLDYLERNKKAAADELLKTVRKLDEAKVDAICDKLMDCDYDDSLDAYHDIFKGDFLPDIKEDALGRIIRRLEGIKRDECRSLVGKLIRDTGFNESDIPGVYMYDVARMWKRECDDADAIIFHNANYCFAPLDAFEYPLMVYDMTKGDDGRKGFLLTPDAVYYGGGGEAGRIKVGDIEQLYVQGGLFGKGIYARTQGGAYRIASRLKDKAALEGYVGRLNRFIGYLKEKPMSRNAEYLIREKHEIKCCLRCGHVYGIGNVCPKCGNGENG
jgi:hypothetical protein